MSLLAGGPGRLAGGPVRLGGGGWAAWLAPAAEEEAFCRSAALAACRLEQVECVDLSECEVATEFEVDTECVDYSDLAAQLAQAQELCDALADECMELRALAWRLRGGARGKPHDELVVGGGYEVDDGVDADGSDCEALGELESIVGCDGNAFGKESIVGCDGDVFSKDGSGCEALLAKESIMGCDGDAFDKDSIVGCDGDAFGKDGSGCEALDALEPSWGATATRSARSRPSRRSRRWPWRASWSSRMLLPRRALLVRPCWARELPAGPTRWSSSRRASSASSSWTRATGTWSSWPTVPLPPGVGQRWTPARPRSASCRMCWSRCPWTSRRLGARRRRRRSSTRSCFGPTSWGRLWAWTAWRRRTLVLLARRASGLSSRRPTPRACRPTSPSTWCGTRWSSDVRRGGPRRAQGLAQKLGAPFDCPGDSSA
ncbi:unnamed protein product [Prorocentrum cordatum]|uniref:Uncharacterized protein n=1 Tax=Prorocentrum cordatum TaxID=2364126 RepID=A0ABN9SSJ4_9DINO|nr:unnamed protein product [Polarella glacialis]